MTTTSYNPEPLTSSNAAVVFVDNQVGLMTGIRDYSIAELKHNIAGLAKAALALEIPIVTTTTSSETLWGPAIPELQAALPSRSDLRRQPERHGHGARASRRQARRGRPQAR